MGSECRELAYTTHKSDFPYDGDHFEFPINEYDVVAVMSDGVETFQKKEGRSVSMISHMEAVEKLLDIKGTNGEFITRPARWMLDKFCPANGWHHTDDVAVAAIYTGELVH